MYTPLGWMSLDRIIQVKKLLFLRTILVMKDEDVCKRILIARTNDFADNFNLARQNEFCSPIFDILNVSIQVGMYDICMRMITTGCYLSKEEWKKLVWEKVWLKEDEDCELLYKQPHQNYLLFNVSDKPYYLVWWLIADLYPQKMRMCEIMSSLVCDTSLLKASDYRLKKKSFSHKICTRCYQGTMENVQHIVMQCPYYVEQQRNMAASIEALGSEAALTVLNDSQNFFYTVMGKHPAGISFQSMTEIWLITGDFISRIYKCAIAGHK